MSVIDNGERFPIVSYFGETKQKVINSNTAPHRNAHVKIDILDYLLPNEEIPDAPTSEKVVITSICGKFFTSIRRRTYTNAQLTAAAPLQYQNSLSGTSARVLAGAVEKLPATYPPPFYSNVPDAHGRHQKRS